MNLKPKHLLLIIAVLIVGGAFIIAQSLTANAPGATRTDGSRVTKTLSTAPADATFELPVRLLEGDDASHESDHIFETLAALPGVATATLDTETLTLDIGYASGMVDESAIRRHMFLAGYAGIMREDTTAAETGEDGVQRISVADDGAQFVPSLIAAKPGAPIEIVFGPGSDCRTSVSVPQLGVTLDISQGGTMSLPPLDPGSYAIQCGGGATEGAIIVE